jgi:hypothetical protein
VFVLQAPILPNVTNPCSSIAMNRMFRKPGSISGHRSMTERCAHERHTLACDAADSKSQISINHLLLQCLRRPVLPVPFCSFDYLPNTKPHIRPSTHQSTTTVTTKMATNFNMAILSPLLAIRPNLPALPRIDVLIFENVSLVLSRTS